jgi:amino acid permease
LSYVFVLSGYMTGIIFLCIGAFASYRSNMMIARMAIDHKLGNLDQIAFAAGGDFLRKFLQIMLILCILFACIGFQVLMGALLSYIMESLMPSNDQEFFQSFKFRLCVNVPIAVLILFPLSLKRDMSSLAFAGVLSVVALFYTMLVLIVQAPWYYQEYVDKPETQINAFKIDMNILTSLALVLGSYTCQFALLPIYSELVRPSYRRIEKVVRRAILVDFFFYMLISCAGYFSQFNYTSDVVI